MAHPYVSKTFVVAAGKTVELQGVWPSLFLLSATAPDNVQISFNGLDFAPLPFALVLGNVKTVVTDRIYIKNTSVATNTIVIGVGDADIRDNRVSGDVNATITNFPATQPVSGTISVGNLSTLESGAIFVLDTAASVNASVVVAHGAKLKNVTIVNCSAAPIYLRVYDHATAPTVGVDVPEIVVAVPATSSKEVSFYGTIIFNTGIAIAVTAGIAYNDATAVAAHDAQITISY
jgi:hypothetical protein